MTTMRDVAARAGVSAKTVSRVFNDDPHVLPETRARVAGALRELGYVPNSLAQSFRTGRPPVVGVAVPDLADPFFAVLAKAVEEVAASADMAVLVSSIGYDARREAAALESLLGRTLSGLVVAPTSQDHGHLATWATRLPIVFVDRPPRNLAADTFTGDDRGGGRIATEHLLGRGHREIAFVGDSPAMTTTAERLAGHRAALADAGLRPGDELVAFGAVDQESAEQVVARLRSAARPPTALITGDARTTMTLVPALAGSSWALVGFGDFPMAHMLSPALTVVDQDPAALGRLAAERVVARIGAPGRRFRRQTVRPVRLLERRSCWSPADAGVLFPSSCPGPGAVDPPGGAAAAHVGTRLPDTPSTLAEEPLP
ncbi:LacI family DNA-binding transcriptional regulator [Blastococcus sp. SYSU DS0533]